ncbi:hypothetical protein [Maribacter algicola]|nr:hypothetical protein [Maribacter algicola]
MGCLIGSLVLAQPQSKDQGLYTMENIHLHLNKTKYLMGEQLWFKAYVWDQKQKVPSMGTTNLHVGIYNNQGKEIKRKLLLVESGMAQGEFVIDSALSDTEYTIMAWTNFMQNFEHLPPFQQRIQILKDGIKSEDSLEKKMKISIYPEGGQLIEGAYNNIGIFIDNGLGQGIQINDIELIDDRGKRIQHKITTNSFGMAKTAFLVEAGKSYYLQSKQQELPLIRQRLPNAIKNRVGLSINNQGKEKVLFRLVSSKETLSAKDGDTYMLGVYQDDFLMLENIEIDKREPVISLAREKLPFGTLTATLFDEDLSPVAYRMFFNHKNQKSVIRHVEIDHDFTEFDDSLKLNLRLPKDMQEAEVSLSALPKESLAYDAYNSISSSFLLRPYTNKTFQDRYFFDVMDRRKQYELDLRLMIEGWGKYDWSSKEQGEVELAFEMESGIPFYGKVLDANLMEENQIALLAELSPDVAFAELDRNKSFKGNMVLFNGDSLGVSLLDGKGKLRKPKAEISFGNPEETDLSILEWLNNNMRKKQNDEVKEKFRYEPLNIGERTIALDEVIVTENAYKKKKTEMFVTDNGIISEGRIIRDADIERYNSVSSYLATLGYRYSKGLDADGFYVDVLLNPKNNSPVSVDSRLLSLPLSSVKAIYFDIEKEIFVSIVLRDRAYESPEQRMKFVKFAIENGFTLPQEYFRPNYSNYGNQLFKDYGALDWKANISINSEIPKSVKIPLKNQNGIQLYIEGMDREGSLISQKEFIGIQTY